MTELAALAEMARAAAWGALLVFLRVGAMMALLPGFGEAGVPVRVRLAAAVAFTIVCAPALADRTLPPPGLAPAAVEIAAGLALGAGLRLMIVALQVAGSIAANAASLSQIAGGMAGEPQPAIANVLIVAGLALAMAGGLHVRAAELILVSYEIVPPGLRPGGRDAAAWATAQVAHVFGLGFALAAPFVIAAAVYNLALGAINRAMPTLMVAFVGAPLLTLGGLALLAVAAPLMLSVWTAAFAAHVAAPFGPGAGPP